MKCFGGWQLHVRALIEAVDRARDSAISDRIAPVFARASHGSRRLLGLGFVADTTLSARCGCARFPFLPTANELAKPTHLETAASGTAER